MKRIMAWLAPNIWRLAALLLAAAFLAIYAVSNRYWYYQAHGGIWRADRLTGHVDHGRWTDIVVGMEPIRKSAIDKLFVPNPGEPTQQPIVKQILVWERYIPSNTPPPVFDLTPYLDVDPTIRPDSTTLPKAR